MEGRGREGKGEVRGGEETRPPPLHAPLIHISAYAPDFCLLLFSSPVEL